MSASALIWLELGLMSMSKAPLLWLSNASAMGGQTIPDVPTTKHTSAAEAALEARSMIPGQ
jgi:hypothetical protein